MEPSHIIIGDVLEGLAQIPEASIHCAVTSPPYWGLRDYGVEGQIGREPTPEAFVAKMVEVFAAVRRVLRDDGTLWLNIGDSYNAGGKGGHPGNKSTLEGYTGSQDQARAAAAMTRYKRKASKTADHGGWTETENGAARVVCQSLKPKDLCMMPWRVALALQADGWYLRSVIVWHKRSPMPESVTDRPTSSWEPIFLLTKSDRYFYDAEAVKEGATGLPPGNVRPVKGTGIPEHRTREGLHQIEATQTRNQRNVWTLSAEPYPEAHFATFPSEIPRRAIKAGTSEKGACPACGAPWTRVVEKWHENPGNRSTNGRKSATKDTGDLGGCGYDVRLETRSKTTGWASGCDCNAGEPVPCVVLDPFLGSGTTVATARELGRHGVGIELNPTYAELARVRIAKAERPHTYQNHVAAPAEGGLFA